jgi:hypothetical protein
MRTSMHLSIFPFPTFGYVPSRTLVGIVVLAARFELVAFIGLGGVNYVFSHVPLILVATFIF